MNRMMTLCLAAASLGAAFASPAEAMPFSAASGAAAAQGRAPLATEVQYRRTYRYDRFGRPVVVDRYRPRRDRRDDDRRYYERARRGGAAAAAGIGGLAAGALIGGAIAGQQQAQAAPAVDPDYIAYCSRKYRSFDPASGTYLGYDGQRHVCRYP